MILTGTMEVLGEKPVSVPLCPAKTCFSATVSGKNLFQCHRVRQKPVSVPVCPAKTCFSATVSGKNLFQWHCVRQKPVPVALCPAKTCSSGTVSGKNLTFADLEPNRGLRCERSATCSLNHGTTMNYEIC
jgi:hypothetical protein